MNPLLDETSPDYDPDLALWLGMIEERQQGDLVSTCREIVAAHSARRYKGVLIDAVSAQALVAVADKLNEKNRDKLAKMDPVRAMDIVWGLVK
jgi:hypothetical protein